MQFRAFLLPLVSAVALTACLPPRTPRDLCIARNSGDITTINELVRETQGNVDRGYALITVEEEITRRTFCEGTNEDGSTFRFPCDETRTRERQEAVAIDVAAEQIKLNQLLDRQAAAQRRYEAVVRECTARFPEV